MISCLKLFRVKKYLLTFLLLLISPFVVYNAIAQNMKDDQIQSAIDKQTTGRLPGAKITGGSGNSVNVEFNLFEPVGVTSPRELEIPGLLEVPTCYFYDSDGEIRYTNECDSTTTPITMFYTDDGTEVNPGLIDVALPGVNMGTEEGDVITYNGEELYVTKKGFETYPYDSSKIVNIVGDVNGDGVINAGDSGMTPNDMGEYLYLETRTVFEPQAGTRVTFRGCDWDINEGMGSPEYHEGYNKDYDCYDPNLDIDAIRLGCSSGGNIDYVCVFDELEDSYRGGSLCPSGMGVEPLLPNEVMRYPTRKGQPIFTATCEPATQCVEDPANPGLAVDDGTGNPKVEPIFAGDVVNIYDPLGGGAVGSCSPVRQGQTNPLVSVRGDSRTVNQDLPLFLQRFFDEYPPSLMVDLLDDAPNGVVENVSLSITNPIVDLTLSDPPYQSLGVTFELALEGDYMCIYAYADDRRVTWRVEAEYFDSGGSMIDPGFPGTMHEVLDLLPAVAEGATVSGSTYAENIGSGHRHCLRAAYTPQDLRTLDLTDIISPVCTGYDVFVPGRNIDWSTSATGVPPPITSNWSRPFTGVVVECIYQTMRNVFIHDPAEPDRLTFFQSVQDKFFTLVRSLLILYVIFFGYRLVISKNPPTRQECILFGMRLAIIVYFSIGNGVTELYPSFNYISRAMTVHVMEVGLESSVDNGYEYCDFRAASGIIYTPGHEYMAIWDTIDCKLSKYLGIGDNWIDVDNNGLFEPAPGGPDEITWNPQVLWVAATAVVSTGFGLPIFIITVVVILFLILLIVRAVHIYILAFMGLIMLLFISPLIIPAALFGYTRDIFLKWLQQVISFLVQPVILFGFLSFALVVIDIIYFGGNRSFVPIASDTVPIPYQIEASTGTGGQNGQAIALEQCDDPDAIGCIFQVARIHKIDVAFISDLTDIKFYKVVLNQQDLTLLVGLLKLLLVCVIIKALLGTVEKLASKLTGGDLPGGGTPVIGPAAGLAAQGGIVNTGVRSVTTAFAGNARAFERLGASRRLRAGTGGMSLLETDIAVRNAGGRGGRTEDNSLIGKAMKERVENNKEKGLVDISDRLRPQEGRTEEGTMEKSMAKDQKKDREVSRQEEKDIARPSPDNENLEHASRALNENNRHQTKPGDEHKSKPELVKETTVKEAAKHRSEAVPVKETKVNENTVKANQIKETTVKDNKVQENKPAKFTAKKEGDSNKGKKDS
ncbi:MAG: hypothetical protein COV35_09935 [Alphaproteobacteria bacterium CG11_big_fil_rev_8_21_14_0_20_39_49]|nr:MAG: hypothetical protein COV35_09935 [Alphaproteobacteria bacterium CG11_big_fil_rev_8_21_14_0_20_39_49]